MQVAIKQSYTPAEYLELEEKAEYKSEYVNGQIFPMTCGSTNHNHIVGNLCTDLHFALKHQDYDVFMLNLRLWIPEKQIYTYPNAMVIKGEIQYFANRTDTVANPLIIAEVFSKSSNSYARQAKFEDYRTIPSFHEYLLIDQNCIYVEHYAKIEEKRWELRIYNAEDEAVALSSIPVQISLKDLYNKVNFELND